MIVTRLRRPVQAQADRVRDKHGLRNPLKKSLSKQILRRRATGADILTTRSAVSVSVLLGVDDIKPERDSDASRRPMILSIAGTLLEIRGQLGSARTFFG